VAGAMTTKVTTAMATSQDKVVKTCGLMPPSCRSVARERPTCQDT
jgi:hypothetical protein